MKCPYCGVEMIPGYLNCGAVLWSEKKHKVSLTTDGKELYALQLRKPLMSPHHVQSDLCPRCKRIILDSSGYDSNINSHS